MFPPWAPFFFALAADGSLLRGASSAPRRESLAGQMRVAVVSNDGEVWVPVGGFADPSFPPPTASIYESRRHPWVAVPAAIEHHED